MKISPMTCSVLYASIQLLNAEAIDVEFPTDQPISTITSRLSGQEFQTYTIEAKAQQFLSVSLRPNNQYTEFKLYLPGPQGPKNLLSSTAQTQALEYHGQLFEDGNHSITVYLDPEAATQGRSSEYDLVIRLANPAPATAYIPDDTVASASSNTNKAQLLERQSKLAPSIGNSPASIALAVLTPDILGQVTQLQCEYDNLEVPSTVQVLITESGILDDDLLGIDHRITLLKNSRGAWRINAYSKAEKRR
ncbi:hypothetical protein [Rubritalea marina]|uniref:hypothetical protein n=1 Tax=Rubritalea marina TaxID=361055 RepID=UPI00035DE555|nr:hypothetical protein [Rubritalea marina]